VAAYSGEARSSDSYGNRVVLLMLSPACGDVVARLEAERGTISREEQHLSGRTHFRVGMQPHVNLNSPNKGPDTPSPYLRGWPYTTGRSEGLVVDKCRVG